ncbi:MAG: HD-GYP domain-containing protein [Candidatus Atribacteria bacterium]|nr:HD-GYP domain-containing protein [Candidatus Atribacteria bacterium]
MQNINDGKEKEIPLSDEHQRLLAVFYQIDQPIYISDPETYDILFINPALQKKMGSVLGQKCFRVLHGFRSPCIFCTNQTIFHEKKGETLVWEFFNQNDKHWYRCIDKSIPWPDGHHVRYEMAIDITREKRTEIQFKQMLDNMQKTMEGTVQAISNMVEMRDPYIAGHQKQVSQLACAIAHEMGYPGERIQGIRLAGLLHDIGKIYLPREILMKPNPLTDIEFNMIKNHPEISYNILKNIEFSWPVVHIILQHHERIDGSGYPKGLKERDILPEAKILSVADVIEAMVSQRPHRTPFHLEEALDEINRHKAVLYDPDVVEACLSLFSKKVFQFESEM